MATSAPVQQRPRSGRRPARASLAAAATALVPAAAFAVLYWAAVLTPQGQTAENALHAAASGRSVADGVGWLQPLFGVEQSLRPVHLAAGLGVLVVVGLLSGRGRLRRTVHGAGVALATLGATEVLKHVVLERPDLAARYGPHANSLPSGHTAAVLGLALGLLLVVPRVLRAPVALAGAFAAGSMAAFVVDDGWHRVSDVLASALVGTTVLCLALALPSPARRRPGRLLALAAGVPVLSALALVVTYTGPVAGFRTGVAAGAVVVAATVLLAARAVPREPGRR
ncbi:phosphatase PAP2 family protein [Kineococcus terrestris]|uniref:phosphatase PAP2 family protein n=1 Tax=Kineococcus terrestris TaxID=2044856 RepID=UPI0034DB41ED